jgi:hypothetical protein
MRRYQQICIPLQVKSTHCTQTPHFFDTVTDLWITMSCLIDCHVEQSAVVRADVVISGSACKWEWGYVDMDHPFLRMAPLIS